MRWLKYFFQEVESGKGEMDVSLETPDKERLCPGHERAMPIERTVMELDVKEEGRSHRHY